MLLIRCFQWDYKNCANILVQYDYKYLRTQLYLLIWNVTEETSTTATTKLSSYIQTRFSRRCICENAIIHIKIYLEFFYFHLHFLDLSFWNCRCHLWILPYIDSTLITFFLFFLTVHWLYFDRFFNSNFNYILFFRFSFKWNQLDLNSRPTLSKLYTLSLTHKSLNT